MQRDEVLRILTEQKPELQKRFGVKSIAIFGSTARNEAGPDSDVDVLVEFDPVFEPSLLDFINLKHYLSDMMNVPVDLVERGSIIPELRGVILNESIYA